MAVRTAHDVVGSQEVVRRLPLPTRKIVGDLTGTDRLLVGLQLRPESSRVTDESD